MTRNDVNTMTRSCDNTTVRTDDLDARLLRGAGRNALLVVIFDHDAPTGGRCPACGWTTSRARSACPSRVLARAVRDRKPVPGWLAHLVDAVPGAIAPLAPVPLAERQAAEDSSPGLFEAPARQPMRRAGGAS